MEKSNLKTRKWQKELQSVKDEAENLRSRRRELMYRLREEGNFTYQQIADIYMCSRQYVEQEIAAYRNQDGIIAAEVSRQMSRV